MVQADVQRYRLNHLALEERWWVPGQLTGTLTKEAPLPDGIGSGAGATLGGRTQGRASRTGPQHGRPQL